MSLNDEQLDHMKRLAGNSDLVCGCGWFFKTECEIYCPHPAVRNPEQTKVNDVRNYSYDLAIKTIETYKKDFYPLKDIEEYKHSNQYRTTVRNVCDRLIKDIEKLKHK